MNEIPALLETLFGDDVYFGGKTFGYQGDSRRHMFMACAVQLAINNERPVRILEIGSWIGSSALTFAQTLRAHSPVLGGSILCVDPWATYINQEDIDKGNVYASMDMLARTEAAYELFKHNTKMFNENGIVQIKSLRGTSADLLNTIQPDGDFDFIYIDGSHYCDEVLQDIRNCAALLREGGILSGDDLEVQADEVDMDFLKQHFCEDFIRDPRSGVGYHPGVTMAVHRYFGRKIFSLIGFWAVRKEGDRFEDISLAGTIPLIPEHFTHDMKMNCLAALRPGG